MKKQSQLLLTVSFLFGLQTPQGLTMESKGEQNQQDCSSLRELLKTVDQNIPSSLKEAVFVFGQTGTGKSTLINSLLGVPLVIEKGLPTAKVVLKEGYKGTYAPIGGRSTSQTTLPQIYGSYCDCPGYNDSKGEGQNIANGYAISKMLRALGKNGSARFILVVSEKDLGDRQEGLIQTVYQMAHSFDSADRLLNSISLVVTKNRNWEKTSLIDLIDKILKEGVEGGNTCLTDKAKAVLESLRQNPDRLSFFPQPDKKLIGQALPLEWSKEILQTLDGSQWSQNLASRMELSAGSKLLLKNLWDSFLQESDCWLKDTFSQKLTQYVQGKILTSLQSLKSLRSEFSSLSQELSFKNQNVFQAFEKLEKLSKEAQDVQTLEGLQAFENKLQFLAGLDPTLLENPYEFKGLKGTREDLHALSQSPKIDSTSQNLTVSGLLVGVSDICSYLSGRQFKEISLYALNTFWVDSSITAHGTNVNVLAPHWRIVSASIFELGGNSGTPHFQGRASLGCSGLPGLPGGSGGNFYGKGTTFKGLGQLTLNVSGGKGGKGQQGGDGKNGRDAGDLSSASREAKEALERDVKRSRSDKMHMISSTEVEGFWGSLSRAVLTGGNKKYKEIYEISISGESGGDGAPGGIGGVGGFPGSVLLEKGGCKELPNIVPNQGSKGENGPSGNPGRGGRYGIYQGTYLNEYMFADARIDQYATGFFDALGKSLKSTWGTVTAPIGAIGAELSSEWESSPSFDRNDSKRAPSGNRNYSLNESPLQEPLKASGILSEQKKREFLKIKEDQKSQPGYRRFTLTL